MKVIILQFSHKFQHSSTFGQILNAPSIFGGIQHILKNQMLYTQLFAGFCRQIAGNNIRNVICAPKSEVMWHIRFNRLSCRNYVSDRIKVLPQIL